VVRWVCLTTASSGSCWSPRSRVVGLGFLLKMESIYRPDAYLLGTADALSPGTGRTPFEELATFVFGLVYVVPLLGMA
jgi:hypothetical protein